MAVAQGTGRITPEKALYEFLTKNPDGNGEQALEALTSMGIKAQEALDVIYKYGTVESHEAPNSSSKEGLLEKVAQLRDSNKITEKEANEFAAQINAFTTTTDESAIVRKFEGNSAKDTLVQDNMPDPTFKTVGNKTVVANPAEEGFTKELRDFMNAGGPRKIDELLKHFSPKVTREQFLDSLSILKVAGYVEINENFVQVPQLSMKTLLQFSWENLSKYAKERLVKLGVESKTWVQLREAEKKRTPTVRERLEEARQMVADAEEELKTRLAKGASQASAPIHESSPLSKALAFEWKKLPKPLRESFTKIGVNKKIWEALRKTKEDTYSPMTAPVPREAPQKPVVNNPQLTDEDHNGSHTRVYNAIKDKPEVKDPWKLANYVVHKNNMENMSKESLAKVQDKTILAIAEQTIEDMLNTSKDRMQENDKDFMSMLHPLPDDERHDGDHKTLDLPTTEADAVWWWKNMSESDRKDALKAAGHEEVGKDFAVIDNWFLLPSNVQKAIQDAVMVTQALPDESNENDVTLNKPVTYADGRKASARQRAKPTQSVSTVENVDLHKEIVSLENDVLGIKEEQIINPRQEVLGYGPDGVKAKQQSLMTSDDDSNEADYPWNQCIDDNKDKGMDSAKKICGSIKAKYGGEMEDPLNPPIDYADGRKSQARTKAQPDDTVMPEVEETIDRGTYKCQLCNKDFLKQDDYSIHMKGHSEEAMMSPYQLQWNNLTPLQRYFELNKKGLKGAEAMENWTAMWWDQLPIETQFILGDLGASRATEALSIEMDDEYDIQVVNKDSGEVIETLRASNQYDAELMSRTLSQNMNVNLYEIKIKPAKEANLDEFNLQEKQVSDTDTFPMSSLTTDEKEELEKLKQKKEGGEELSGQELTRLYELNKKGTSQEADWNAMTNDERAKASNKLKLDAMDISKIVNLPMEEIKLKYPGIASQLEALEAKMPKSCGCPVVAENYWQNSDLAQRQSLLDAIGAFESGEIHMPWSEISAEFKKAIQETIAKEERIVAREKDSIMPSLKQYLTEQNFSGVNDRIKVSGWIDFATSKGFTAIEAKIAYEKYQNS